MSTATLPPTRTHLQQQRVDVLHEASTVDLEVAKILLHRHVKRLESKAG